MVVLWLSVWAVVLLVVVLLLLPVVLVWPLCCWVCGSGVVVVDVGSVGDTGVNADGGRACVSCVVGVVDIVADGVVIVGVMMCGSIGAVVGVVDIAGIDGFCYEWGCW